jgi:hypothetical protein
MVRLELLHDSRVVAITPQGPLEESDFERLAQEIGPLIEKEGKIAGLMIEAGSFPGWISIGAFLSHLKFVYNHHRHLDRIAIITDDALLKMMPRVAGLLVKPTIRRFASGDKAQAFAWLETGA